MIGIWYTMEEYQIKRENPAISTLSRVGRTFCIPPISVTWNLLEDVK